jgi:hypothetical protein
MSWSALAILKGDVKQPTSSPSPIQLELEFGLDLVVNYL